MLYFIIRCDNCKLCYHFGCLDPPVKVRRYFKLASFLWIVRKQLVTPMCTRFPFVVSAVYWQHYAYTYKWLVYPYHLCLIRDYDRILFSIEQPKETWVYVALFGLRFFGK